VTVPLRSAENASPFWIILLLVSGQMDHGPIRREAQCEGHLRRRGYCAHSRWSAGSSPAIGETGSISTQRGSNPLSSASHHGLSPAISSTRRSVDISGGWRPKARFLPRNVGHLVRKAQIFGASLCSMNFQYPKFWDWKVRDRLRFRGDRFEYAFSRPWPSASGMGAKPHGIMGWI
jgi:hypothetical protein